MKDVFEYMECNIREARYFSVGAERERYNPDKFNINFKNYIGAKNRSTDVYTAKSTFKYLKNLEKRKTKQRRKEIQKLLKFPKDIPQKLLLHKKSDIYIYNIVESTDKYVKIRLNNNPNDKYRWRKTLVIGVGETKSYVKERLFHDVCRKFIGYIPYYFRIESGHFDFWWEE